MFQMVNTQIILPGVEQGIFSAQDPEVTTALVMTLYLGTGSQVGPEGRNWFDPRQVAAFAWNALRTVEPAPDNDG